MEYFGKKVYIRQIQYDDTDDIVRWRNTKFVRDNFIFRAPFTAAIHENWLRTMVETGKTDQFIIIELESGNKIGSVYLRDIDRDNRKCEFGIFIGEEKYLGKGYGKEATQLILDHAFQHLKMHKVYLRVLKYNERAYNTYINAGFHVEGTAKDDVWLDGHPIDVIFMAILEGE
ncbi:MAG: GNAT family N-acetyltransferase [Clostridiales bacterium]|nr:GNAT family N-acetyltransferase [Clostridiales bacterium]